MSGPRPRRALRTSAAVLAAATLGLTLAACGDSDDAAGGGSDTETAANGDVFNDADVEFATAMIPHHAQAIQMVTLTDGRSLDPAVKELADSIREAQAPEVEVMVDWLTAWDEDVPETSLDHTHAGHDPSEMSDMDDVEGMDDMPGMMSTEEMQALADASDAEFEDLFLEMMERHHEGAVEMAEDEQQRGSFPDAVTLAESIQRAQESEIEQIERLLGS